MRNVVGLRQSRDASLTAEAADLLVEEICSQCPDPLRESWAVRCSAAEDSVRLVAFDDPRTGAPRWAVVQCHQGLWQVRDSGSRAEADAEYEATVRRLTRDGGYRWSITDVSGTNAVGCGMPAREGAPRRRRAARAGLRPPTRSPSR